MLFQLIMVNFPERPLGPEAVWFLGDNFLARSFRNHYRKQTPPSSGPVTEHFIKENFEFGAHCSSRWSSANENMLQRIRNSLVTALNQEKSGVFPKFIIVVLDDDLITFLDFKHEGVATLLGSWVSWLVKEFDEIIKTRNGQLPLKLKKYNPFFYWVTAPTHSGFSKARNNLRVKFNLSLESVIRSHSENMRVIKLKEGWNTADNLLVTGDRMTETGLSAYWNAIDASFHFNSVKRDLFVAKKLVQRVTTDHNKVDSGRDIPAHTRSTSASYVARHDVARDPMRDFFDRRRERNVEYRMGAREDYFREDFSGRRRIATSHNRFMLPRLHNRHH